MTDVTIAERDNEKQILNLCCILWHVLLCQIHSRHTVDHAANFKPITLQIYQMTYLLSSHFSGALQISVTLDSAADSHLLNTKYTAERHQSKNASVPFKHGTSSCHV